MQLTQLTNGWSIYDQFNIDDSWLDDLSHPRMMNYGSIMINVGLILIVWIITFSIMGKRRITAMDQRLPVRQAADNGWKIKGRLWKPMIAGCFMDGSQWAIRYGYGSKLLIIHNWWFPTKYDRWTVGFNWYPIFEPNPSIQGIATDLHATGGFVPHLHGFGTLGGVTQAMAVQAMGEHEAWPGWP